MLLRCFFVLETNNNAPVFDEGGYRDPIDNMKPTVQYLRGDLRVDMEELIRYVELHDHELTFQDQDATIFLNVGIRGLKVMSGLFRESSVLSEKLNNLQER
jgi:hypothetical protein